MEQFEIAWNPATIADLDAAAAQRTPPAAASLGAALSTDIARLASLPRLGAAFEGDSSGTAREIQCRQFRVIDRVDDAAKRVEILRVWPAARRGTPRLPGA